ncbi:MAG: 16S rRNA (guanine(966)-N(2))-methyltransferase RsmD [Gemmatimonadota bacterium]|nr:MAG: 16S rRNA (guanine(966)-N(2))-methyltransferase RsmD [Gemmatimonadota bacterium]
MGDLRIVAGRWGRRRLKAPPGRRVRPTSERAREAWLNRLAADLPGATVLDLFAGSGALGLEALSRGARHVTLVEISRRALRSLRDNVEALDAAAEVTIVSADVFRFLEGVAPEAFDIALADPPYSEGLASRLVSRYVRNPFARLLSVEHELGEDLEAVPGAELRRYGDTAITFIRAADLKEESENG